MEETIWAMAKFKSMPMVPMPSTAIPKNQGATPKKRVWMMVCMVKEGEVGEPRHGCITERAQPRKPADET
ncbi:hypothetical protein [Desulfonatronum sp. SC1]|uniref:hypothetical protein n=1 Tax=Desulfonatronum sp. SC1 TaxID=2109626 RepID=UPI00130489EC|nr:hypothetical protein [Desulfonatronum sp. SC1]